MIVSLALALVPPPGPAVQEDWIEEVAAVGSRAGQ